MSKVDKLTTEVSALQKTRYDPVPITGEQIQFGQKKSDTGFLIFSTLTASLYFFIAGTVFAWTSPVIPKLLSNDTDINPLKKPITTEEISLLAGLPLLLSVIGAFVGPRLSNKMGRKKSLQIIGCVLIISDVATAFSEDITLIIASKSVYCNFFVAGMSIIPSYITEVCEDHNRGKYGCLIGIFIPSGSLYVYLLGPVSSLKIFILLCMVPTVAFTTLFTFVPESPVYLLSKGRIGECKKALRGLRSNKTSAELEIEFDKLDQSLIIEKNSKVGNTFEIFTRRENRIGMLIAFFPMFLQFGSGLPILKSFMAPVFNKAGTSISGNNIAIIVGLIQVLGIGPAIVMVDRVGRRPLLLVSSIGCCLTTFTLGLMFYLIQINPSFITSFQWLPIVLVIIYDLIYTIGLAPIPPLIIAEVFTHDLRAASISFIMTIVSVFVVVGSFSFPLMIEYWGVHWTMWCFSLNCILGSIAIYILLPETKGKSIPDIQLILKNYTFQLRRTKNLVTDKN